MSNYPPPAAATILANAGISASRLCVFGRYTPPDTITEGLGFYWPPADETGIQLIKSEDLIVAANSDAVVAWAMVPRAHAQFLRPDGYGCGSVEPVD